MRINLSIIHKTILSTLLIVISIEMNAQSKSYGNLIVENKGELKLYGSHLFLSNSKLPNKGILGTERRNLRGFIAFMPNSSQTGASDSAFVDGYVRSYNSGSFIFPIGDNKEYRPCKIEKSTLANPTDAAYYKADPGIAITTSFFGQPLPVLPSDGPFNTSLIENTLVKVSNREYWDINGTTPTKITLTWDISSNITPIVGGLLNDLCIVGWNGSKWIKIDSKVDNISIFGSNSDLNKGSITTALDIIPNTYSVYSLAGKLPDANEVFSKKSLETQIWQQNIKPYSYSYLPAINDTNLTISIVNSTPKFGKLTAVTKNGYTYTAGDTLGVDSIKTIATIFNKRVSKTYYDTFIQTYFVRYKLKDSSIDMGTFPQVSLGKKYFSSQPLVISYSYKVKKGSIVNYNKGTFDYKTNIKNSFDTMLYIFKCDYLGIQYTSDTTKYYIKTTTGPISIYNADGEEIFIQNIIEPYSSSSDNWYLPEELTSKYPKLSISISNINGQEVYRFIGKYNNDFNAHNLPEGNYIYLITAEDNLKLNGTLKVVKR